MSGDSMTSIHYLYRVSLPSVSITVKAVCCALWTCLQPIHLPSSEHINWRDKAEGFDNLWNFPNCIGAIDGKHIAVQAPAKSGSLYYNYKGFYSIVLLAICDAKYKFVAVDIGAAGRESDGGVFSRSEIGNRLENKNFGVPSSTYLPKSDKMCNYVLVGDEAFPLKPYLMRPYPGRGRERLNQKSIIFNYRLCRARRTIENTFGVMSSRMRIFRATPAASSETIKCVVMAAVCLHNFLQATESSKEPSARKYCPPTFVDHLNDGGTFIEGEWRKEGVPLVSVSQADLAASNNYRREAEQQRQIFADYFFDVGSVPWQWKKVTA